MPKTGLFQRLSDQRRTRRDDTLGEVRLDAKFAGKISGAGTIWDHSAPDEIHVGYPNDGDGDTDWSHFKHTDGWEIALGHQTTDHQVGGRGNQAHRAGEDGSERDWY